MSHRSDLSVLEKATLERIRGSIRRAIAEVDQAVADCRTLSMAHQPLRNRALAGLSDASFGLGLLLGQFMEGE